MFIHLGKHNIQWFALCVILTIIVYGCSQTSPTTPAMKATQIAPMPLTVPSGLPSDAYGNFYTYEGSGSSFNIFNGDTITTTMPAGSRSVAIFGSGDTIASVSMNGTAYTKLLDGSNAQYQINSATFYTDGTNNIYTYTVQGNTYHDTINAAIGNITMSSPSFKQLVSKDSGLTVTWSPSTYDSDYVEITFQQDFIVPNPGHDTVIRFNDSLGYYSTFTDDNGSITIPSTNLAHCTAPSATITLARGTYKEVTHGSNKYLFVIYSSQSIDVFLH